MLRVGVSFQSRTFSVSNRKCAVVNFDEKASNRICHQFQQEAPAQRAAFSKPIQINRVTGGFLSERTGSQHSPETPLGRFDS